MYERPSIYVFLWIIFINWAWEGWGKKQNIGISSHLVRCCAVHEHCVIMPKCRLQIRNTNWLPLLWYGWRCMQHQEQTQN